MKKKVYFVMFMVAIIVLTFNISGCVKKPSGIDLTKDISQYTGEVKFLLPGSAPADLNNVTDKINQALAKDNRNYTIKLSFVNWSDYWTQVGLKSRSYDAFSTSIYYTANFYSQKIIDDITPIMEKFGKDIISSTPKDVLKSAQVNGKTVFIPSVVPTAGNQEMLMTTTKWLKRANMQKVETMQEVEQFLKNCKDWITQNNVTGAYVMDKDSGDFLKREYAKNYYFPMGQWGANPFYIDLNNRLESKYVVNNFYESDAYKAMVDKNAIWYEEGYRSTNYGDISDMEAMFNNDLLATIWNSGVKTSERIEAFRSNSLNNGEEMYDIILNPDEKMWTTMSSLSGIAPYKGSKNKVQVVDFINWLRKDRANFDLFTYGIDGINHHLKEDGTITYDAYKGLPKISESKKYTLISDASAWSTTDNIRFLDKLPKVEVEKYKNWNVKPNVEISPLSGFMITMNPTMDSWYAIISSAETKYMGEFMYGRIKRADIGSGSKTKYENFLSELNANSSMENLKNAIQTQLDAYCIGNNI